MNREKTAVIPSTCEAAQVYPTRQCVAPRNGGYTQANVCDLGITGNLRKLLSLIAFSLIALTLTSCGSISVFPLSRELEELELVRTVGVDIEEDGGITLTAATVPGIEGGGPEFYSVTADSIAGAASRMQMLPVGKEALFSHTESIVLSEAAAERCLAECLDYVERSNDFRIDTNIVIARGSKAYELMSEVSSESSDISELLMFLRDNSSALGEGRVFTCREIASALSRRGSALVQAVRAEAQPGGEEGKTLVPAGLAVIRDGALADFLTEDESRGAVLIMNEVESSGETVYLDGVKIALTVNGAKTALTPKFTDGTLTGVSAAVKLRANIASTDGALDTRGDDVRRKIENALAETERERVISALAASQEKSADFMDIFSELSMKKPVKMAKLENDWDSVFADIPIFVSVECELSRTYDLETGVNTEGEETVTIWKIPIK